MLPVGAGYIQNLSPQGQSVYMMRLMKLNLQIIKKKKIKHYKLRYFDVFF